MRLRVYTSDHIAFRHSQVEDGVRIGVGYEGVWEEGREVGLGT